MTRVIALWEKQVSGAHDKQQHPLQISEDARAGPPARSPCETTGRTWELDERGPRVGKVKQLCLHTQAVRG